MPQLNFLIFVPKRLKWVENKKGLNFCPRKSQNP